MPGSVSKHGNPRLRAALVELVWRMVRFQPNYGPVKKAARDPGQWRSLSCGTETSCEDEMRPSLGRPGRARRHEHGG